MKRNLVLLLAALFIFTLTGCAAAQGGSIPAEDEIPADAGQSDGNDSAAHTAPSAPDISTASLGITLSAKDATPSGLTIVCTQSGGEPTGELSSGSYYIIERQNGGSWEAVEYLYDGSQGELAWTSEAWLITMDGTVEWPVDWSWLYGTLDAGTYRIGKEIMDWRSAGDYDIYIAYAEFEIR